MNNLDYFLSITLELAALKNRVQHFITDKHWLTVGEWRESVLRTILRRHLPQDIGVGRGFVITTGGPSTQIDILLYDRTKPLLYHDGDMVIITPDLCLGIIEVKTRLDCSELREALNKLADSRQRVSRTAQCSPFVGLFTYEHQGSDHQTLLSLLQKASQGSGHRVIDCVALGTSLFSRYWYCAPERPRRPASIFRAYHLNDVAPAYFVHNVIESICEHSVLSNNDIWYPPDGKESFRLGEIALQNAGTNAVPNPSPTTPVDSSLATEGPPRMQ